MLRSGEKDGLGRITPLTGEEERGKGCTCKYHPSDSRSAALVCHGQGTVEVCLASRRVAAAAWRRYSVHVCHTNNNTYTEYTHEEP